MCQYLSGKEEASTGARIYVLFKALVSCDYVTAKKHLIE